MAISREQAEEKRIIAAVCAKHGIDPSRFLRLTRRPATSGYEQDEIIVEFRSVPMSQDLMNALRRVERMITDEFQGEIIKAAVPELYAAQKAMLKQFSLHSDRQAIRLTEKAVHDILRENRHDPYHASFRY